MVALRTTCEIEIWSGFFGIDANGTQPECGNEIEIDVEPDEYETDEHGDVRPVFAVLCTKCKTWLEWPQIWEFDN